MRTLNVGLLCLASAALAVAVILLGPKLLGRTTPKQRFVTVDLAAIIASQQEESLRQLTQETNEDKRKIALAANEAFGKVVNAEVQAMAKECSCSVLIRQAVIAGDIEDMTPLLAARVSAAALQRRVK